MLKRSHDEANSFIWHKNVTKVKHYLSTHSFKQTKEEYVVIMENRDHFMTLVNCRHTTGLLTKIWGLLRSSETVRVQQKPQAKPVPFPLKSFILKVPGVHFRFLSHFSQIYCCLASSWQVSADESSFSIQSMGDHSDLLVIKSFAGGYVLQ